MFGICRRLQVYHQLREELAKVKTLEGIVDVNRELKLRCQVPIWALIPQNSTACILWECTKCVIELTSVSHFSGTLWLTNLDIGSLLQQHPLKPGQLYLG